MDELREEISRFTTLFKLAHREELERARLELYADPVKAAVLESLTEEWTPARRLQEQVARETGIGERSIRVHLAELVNLGVVARRGATHTTEYRSGGIF